MHDSQQWKETLTENGWTDAFMTGDEFTAFLTEREPAGRAMCSRSWG